MYAVCMCVCKVWTYVCMQYVCVYVMYAMYVM